MTRKKLTPAEKRAAYDRKWKRKAWAVNAVGYHLRCAEAYRRSAASGHIPEERARQLLALAEKFEGEAEYYGKLA